MMEVNNQNEYNFTENKREMLNNRTEAGTTLIQATDHSGHIPEWFRQSTV